MGSYGDVLSFAMERRDRVVYTYFLVVLLLTGSVLCNPDCSLVESGQHWNRMCQIQNDACGYRPTTGTIKSAPRKLRVVDYPYMYSPQQGSSTLAINITWQFPENITELRGFVVELMKTSYPVGFHACKKITFDTILSSESHLSTVNFTLSDWHSIDVDGKYSIKVTSLDSGQVAEMPYHTKSCTDVPQVNKCLIDCSNGECRVAPPESWRPTVKPTVQVSDGSDIVTVIFLVYPGNFWLDYRVNLYSLTIRKTRPELSKKVNSSGSSPYYTIDFDNVPPDEYEARVRIVVGDAPWVRSEAFNVTAVNRIIPTVASKTTRVPVEPTSIQVTKPSHTGTPAEQEPESVSNIVRNAAVTVSSVLIALLIFIGLFICRGKFRQRSESSESATSRPGDEASQLVNGISQADGNFIQNNIYTNGDELMSSICGVSHLQDSIYTGVSEDAPRHKVEGEGSNDCNISVDLGSQANASAVAV